MGVVTEQEALGVILFERGREGLVPTQAATAIAAEADTVRAAAQASGTSWVTRARYPAQCA
ncbi:MAG: hypothetical protein R3D29_08005 [Nitratireductor sp.]